MTRRDVLSGTSRGFSAGFPRGAQALAETVERVLERPHRIDTVRSEGMASATARRRLRLQRYVAGGAIVAMVASGGVLWVVSSNGTKQADLGAGLVSTGLFGLLLLAFERVLSEQTEEVDRKVSLSAAPEPARDNRGAPRADPEEAEPDPGKGGRKAREPLTQPQPPRRFRVEVDQWMRDRSRIDADQLRLIAWADDHYFQFFTAIVPGIAFRVSVHSAAATGVTLAQFHRGIGDLAVRLIRQKISSGEAPRDDDPTLALELFPDVDEAVRVGRGLPDQDHVEGEVIGEWTELPGLVGASAFVRQMIELASESPIGAVMASEQAIGRELARRLVLDGAGDVSRLNTTQLADLACERGLINNGTRDGVDGVAVMHTMALLDNGGQHLTQEKAREYIGLAEGLLLSIRMPRR